jgi:hypothetical protein
MRDAAFLLRVAHFFFVSALFHFFEVVFEAFHAIGKHEQ